MLLLALVATARSMPDVELKAAFQDDDPSACATCADADLQLLQACRTQREHRAESTVPKPETRQP